MNTQSFKKDYAYSKNYWEENNKWILNNWSQFNYRKIFKIQKITDYFYGYRNINVDDNWIRNFLSF